MEQCLLQSLITHSVTAVIKTIIKLNIQDFDQINIKRVLDCKFLDIVSCSMRFPSRICNCGCAEKSPGTFLYTLMQPQETAAAPAPLTVKGYSHQ